MQQVEVKILGMVITAQYGTLNTGDILRTNAEFAKHLVEDCMAAEYITKVDLESEAAAVAKAEADAKAKAEAEAAAAAKAEADAKAKAEAEAAAAAKAEADAKAKALKKV